MDPLEREDSSAYISQSQEQPGATQPPQQGEPPKQKKSRAVAILTVLLLLAVICAVGVGWLWYQQTDQISDLKTNLSKAQSDVAKLKSASKAEAKQDESESVTTDTENSDDELVKAALAFAKSAVNAGEVTATVGKKIDNFAFVNVGSQGSGYYIIFKKVNEIWVPVLHGNGVQTQEMLDYYGVPDELIKS